jgi:hypothetical protein
MEDSDKSKYAAQFARLGVESFADMQILEYEDIIQQFAPVTAKALAITAAFLKRTSETELDELEQLGNRQEWLIFCTQQKIKDDEEKEKRDLVVKSLSLGIALVRDCGT